MVEFSTTTVHSSQKSRDAVNEFFSRQMKSYKSDNRIII